MVTFIILGMHRSCTSMTSRALHESNEVYMGDVFGELTFDNPKGHYEYIPIVKLNEDILSSAGGSWDQPPTHSAILAQKEIFSSRIKQVMDDFYSKVTQKQVQSCGFKDPRLCLTIELYMPYLINPQFISTFRTSDKIAKSLYERNQIDLEKGKILTKEYNTRIFNFLKKYTSFG